MKTANIRVDGLLSTPSACGVEKQLYSSTWSRGWNSPLRGSQRSLLCHAPIQAVVSGCLLFSERLGKFGAADLVFGSAGILLIAWSGINTEAAMSGLNEVFFL